MCSWQEMAKKPFSRLCQEGLLDSSMPMIRLPVSLSRHNSRTRWLGLHGTSLTSNRIATRSKARERFHSLLSSVARSPVVFAEEGHPSLSDWCACVHLRI